MPNPKKTRPASLASPEPETWGESLRRHVMRRGNLNVSVKRIREVTGDPMIGTRNTFAKLFEMKEEPTNQRDRLRAYLLLVSLGYDPAGWGLSNDDLPRAFAATDELVSILRAVSGCIPSLTERDSGGLPALVVSA